MVKYGMENFLLEQIDAVIKLYKKYAEKLVIGIDEIFFISEQ